jgi:DNA-directed RNA polymerase specialized sigma24 family protein
MIQTMTWTELARDEFDAAFASLVSVVSRVVQRFFRYDASAIAPAVAETMARTYDRWDRVHRSSNPAAWVIACAKDVCLEQLRARSEAETETPGAPGRATAICDALDSLSHAPRDVGVLRFMMECDEDTTAVALNLPIERVTMLAEKAEKRLGDVLHEAYAQSDEAVA